MLEGLRSLMGGRREVILGVGEGRVGHVLVGGVATQLLGRGEHRGIHGHSNARLRRGHLDLVGHVTAVVKVVL